MVVLRHNSCTTYDCSIVFLNIVRMQYCALTNGETSRMGITVPVNCNFFWRWRDVEVRSRRVARFCWFKKVDKKILPGCLRPLPKLKSHSETLFLQSILGWGFETWKYDAEVSVVSNYCSMLTHEKKIACFDHHTNYLPIDTDQTSQSTENHGATALIAECMSLGPFCKMEVHVPTSVLQIPTWVRPI
jgi:hypothetical protein